jgi:1-acyl-sn-glycerol-3-phosphate acyltransferase
MKKESIMLGRVVRFLNRFLLGSLIRLEIIGMDKVPMSGAFIATGNHIGLIDALVVYYVLDRDDIIMMIAEKHRKYAFTRMLVKSVGAFFVDRYQADFVAMREVMKRLKSGGVLVIAPEGTRSPSGSLQQGRSGAAYLSAKTGLPILPVSMVGTEDRHLFANLRRLKRAPVTIRVGDLYNLLPLPKEDRDEVLQSYTDEIMCRIAALLPEERRGVYRDYPRVKELIS